MKRMFLTMYIFALAQIVFAQSHLRGKVIDALSGTPVPGATVEIDNVGATATNDSGRFEFRKIGVRDHELRITSGGYKFYQAKINYSDELFLISLEPVQLFLQPIE